MDSILNIDLFFFAAIKQNTELMKMIGYRLFDTMRSSTAEDEDKLPYIIVVSDKSNASTSTKDSNTDLPDRGLIRVLCVAENTERLAKLTSLTTKAIVDANATRAIYDAHPDWDFSRLHISIEPDEKVGDPTKPCLFRELLCYCEI